MSARARRACLGGILRSVVTVDDAQFETLLEQVRELHELTDALTYSSTRIHANVRARLSWNHRRRSRRNKLADEIVQLLERPASRPHKLGSSNRLSLASSTVPADRQIFAPSWRGRQGETPADVT